jgi:hypothetical protein
MKSILVAVVTLTVVCSAFAQSPSRQNFNTPKQGAGYVGNGPAANPSASSAKSNDPLKGANVSKCCHDSPSGVVCKC